MEEEGVLPPSQLARPYPAGGHSRTDPRRSVRLPHDGAGQARENEGWVAMSRLTNRYSVCDKTQEQVRLLIAGSNSVYICDDCVELAHEVIAEQHVGGHIQPASLRRISSPQHI